MKLEQIRVTSMYAMFWLPRSLVYVGRYTCGVMFSPAAFSGDQNVGKLSLLTMHEGCIVPD